MQFTLSILEKQYDDLTSHLFQDRDVERAAYLFCKLSASADEKRLLVRDVVPIPPEEIESATTHDIVIKGESYRRALKRADISKTCFILVHSHPIEYPHHSPQDDREEEDLFRSAYVRIHHPQLVHGSLVLSDPVAPVGRVWLPDGSIRPISRIRVLGRRFSFFDPNEQALMDIALFDRQILAFGEHVQQLLGALHVGIVGLGGTGSAIREQLTRLGVGKLTICDPQRFEGTNINRVYGSRRSDEGNPKTDIAKRATSEIDVGTIVDPIEGAITSLKVVQRFKNCDVIFGCTDDEWGRSILSKLAVMYMIPVFDMGVEVDSENHRIKSVRGRVTSLIPGSPCLFCRGAVTPDVIAAEILHTINPEEYEARRLEGYVPGLPGNAPAVITFTTSIASAAISEMLHRFTGYMGATRESTEIILRFDESKISTNSKPAREGCWCANSSTWGRGDVDPFLDLTWPDANL